MRAHVHGDAAPALELVGARGAVLHAAALVVVVEAGGARHVIVGFSAAAQALAVATLALVCTGERATFRTYWGDRGNGGTDVRQSAQQDAVPTKSRMIKNTVYATLLRLWMDIMALKCPIFKQHI